MGTGFQGDLYNSNAQRDFYGGGNQGMYGSGGSSSNDALSKLLAQFGGGGGLFGLGDLASGGLLSAGGALFGGIAGLLGGKSDAEKRSEKVFNLAQNRMGQDVLHPEQYMADYRRATAGENNRQAERINQRLGLDSGAAQTDIAFRQQDSLAQFMLNSKMQADILKSKKDDMLLALMGGLSGGNYA